MSDSFQAATTREWAEGCYEKVLPEDLPQQLLSAENRLARVERCAEHIKAGAHRSMCRTFVYVESEWRSAVRMAGREPGEGWIMQPWPAHKAKPEPEPEVIPVVQEELPTYLKVFENLAMDDIPF